MPDYRCRICGNGFDNEEEAEKCRARGITMFSHKVGDLVSFTRTRKSTVTNFWVRETFEGIIERIDLWLPKRYPGHEYGIAAMSYFVKEKNGKKSLQSPLLDDPMRVVSAEEFFAEARKMDLWLHDKLERLKKRIS